MNKYEIDELFSEETKQNIVEEFEKDYFKEYPKATKDEFNDYVNQYIGNCYLLMINELHEN